MATKATLKRKANHDAWVLKGKALPKTEHVVIEVNPTTNRLTKGSVYKRHKEEFKKLGIVKDPNDRKSTWRIMMPATPGGKHPMKCRMIGCPKVLRYRQRDIVCSPHCRKELQRYCETIMAVFNEEMLPEDFPYYYRVMGKKHFTPDRLKDKNYREDNLRESKAEQTRRRNRDHNPDRWYSDVPRVPAQEGEAERDPRSAIIPSFSDEEGEDK